MTDLTTYVPDTSKYTDPADRLIALGLALREKNAGKTIQWDLLRKWGDIDPEGKNIAGMAHNCIFGVNYRAKPEPRVVWVVFDKNGYRYAAVESREEAINYEKRWNANDSGNAPYSTVRFVESPDDQ